MYSLNCLLPRLLKIGSPPPISSISVRGIEENYQGSDNNQCGNNPALHLIKLIKRQSSQLAHLRPRGMTFVSRGRRRTPATALGRPKVPAEHQRGAPDPGMSKAFAFISQSGKRDLKAVPALIAKSVTFAVIPQRTRGVRS